MPKLYEYRAKTSFIFSSSTLLKGEGIYWYPENKLIGESLNFIAVPKWCDVVEVYIFLISSLIKIEAGVPSNSTISSESNSRLLQSVCFPS